jgi:hypothetical protein
MLCENPVKDINMSDTILYWYYLKNNNNIYNNNDINNFLNTIDNINNYEYETFLKDLNKNLNSSTNDEIVLLPLVIKFPFFITQDENDGTKIKTNTIKKT